MEMVKKSGIALICGALMISLGMTAKDPEISQDQVSNLSSAPTLQKASLISSMSQFIHLPLLNLNSLTKTQLIVAAALLWLPFYLLHNQSHVPDCITKNSAFQFIIGTPEKDQHKEYEENKDTKKVAINRVPHKASTGIIGKLDSIISRPWEKTSKSVAPLLSILLFLGVIEQISKH